MKIKILLFLGLWVTAPAWAAYTDTVLADNPSGYWRLDAVPTPSYAVNLGATGDTDNGVIGFAVNVAQAGAIAGDASKAMQFAGNGNSRVVVPFDENLNPAGSFTVEFWMNTATGAGASLAPVFSRGGNPGYTVYIQRDGSLQFLQWAGSWQAASTGPGTVPALVGKWVHVACVFDAAAGASGNGVQSIYTNGVLAASHELTDLFQNNTTGTFNLGDVNYAGLLDEVAVYATALSPARIQARYTAGTSGAGNYKSSLLADSPVGYWRLDETEATKGIANLGFLGSAVEGIVNGTLTLATDSPLVGDSNPALNFTGGGYIGLPYHALLNTTNAFSYEIWYNEDAGSSGIRCPLWWRDEPVLGDTRGWVHYLWDDWNPAWGGRGNVFQSSDVYTTWNGLGSAALFAQGEWQHLVGTFDGKNKRIYLNGVLISVSTAAKLKIKPVQRAVTTISSISYPFLGSLDEAAYYTNALSADRIQAHWKAARGVNPPAVAATFATPPKGVTNFEGSTVTLSALVLGTPPFAYQWLKNSATLSGETNLTLTLSPARLADTGDYALQVNNVSGARTSDSAHVSIVTAPAAIVQGPLPATRLQGASVTFTVEAGGSQPLFFQWLSNSVPIPGVAGATLTLSDIQPSFAASYSVTVTNTAGRASSSPVSLTVVPAASGSYAAAVVRDLPVAYWRLDEKTPTAYDLVGGHDGGYDAGLGQGVSGALLGDPDPAVNFPGSGGVAIPWSEDLNSFTAFSVELWARPDPAGTGTERALFASRTTASGWHYGYYLSANASDQWQFNTGHKTSGVASLTGGGPTNQVWYHLVATFDAGTGNKNLYVNGQLAASSTEAVGTFAPNNDVNEGMASDEGIGKTTASDPYTNEGTFFFGEIDDVVVYNYALSPEQVVRHYGVAASPTLTIARAGNPVTITWSQGRLLQANDAMGPWTTNTTAVSPLTLAPSAARQFFRVVVP